MRSHSPSDTDMLLTHTVVDPGAVMVKLSHTTVTHRAVLGSQWLPNQTRATELFQPQSLCLCQFQDCLKTETSSRTKCAYKTLRVVQTVTGST